MFERISVGVKTFLRDPKLFRACDSIIKALPGAQIIVCDDGEPSDTKAIYYEGLEALGHKAICLPFDSGFGVKSNKIIDALDRPYLLMGSDDFDFSSSDVAVGIKKMLDVLDENPSLDVVSGRLRNRGAYEFHLIERQLGEWHERPLTGPEYFNSLSRCDVTINYSLIRREVFDKIRWDDEAKIGEGEHGAFFIDCKRAGIKVAYVPGVFVDEMLGARQRAVQAVS